MKLIPRVVVAKKVTTPTPPTKNTRKRTNTLPSDEYKPLFKPMRVLVRADKERDLKQFLEVSVKRFDDDEAPLMCFICMYQESPKYTGYMKSKSIHFPLDSMGDVEELLIDIGNICDDMGL